VKLCKPPCRRAKARKSPAFTDLSGTHHGASAADALTWGCQTTSMTRRLSKAAKASNPGRKSTAVAMQRYECAACGPHCGRARLRPSEVGAVFLAHHAPLAEPGGLFFAHIGGACGCYHPPAVPAPGAHISTRNRGDGYQGNLAGAPSVFSGKADRWRAAPQVQCTTTCFTMPPAGSPPKKSFLTGNPQRYRPSHLAATTTVTCISLPRTP
jgi:hypothetical protein